MDFATLFADFTAWLEDMAYHIISLLPDSPFALIDNSPIQPYLAQMNWFIPFDYVVALTSIWLTAISIFYVWQLLLRWVRAIG